MADRPRDSGTGDETGSGTPREPSPGAAGWQKVLWILGTVVLVGLAILLIAGDHGPGRHAPGGVQQQQEQPVPDADAGETVGHDPSRFDH